jgi:replicative DNA helicase
MSDPIHEYAMPADPESPAPRVPPHSSETEIAVLSAWSLHDRFGAAWKPEPELFHIRSHRLIADAMVKLGGSARDEASVFAQLEADGTMAAAGGPGEVHSIITGAPAYGDPWPHVVRLRELRALREMLGLVNVATAEAFEHRNLGGTVAKLQEAIRAGTAESGTAVLSVADMIATVAKRMIERAEARYCSTGLPTLDRDTGGLQYQQVAILGAATNWGKSQFCVMVADKTLSDGKRPLLVSFEDSEELYGRRIVARRADVSASLLRANRFKEGSAEWGRILGVAQKAERSPFFINAVGKTAERVATDIRCVCASEDIDLVLVDYIQAAQCARRQQDRRNEITYIARILTDVIKSSGRAGLMFSQFKRQLKSGETPTMHDLKESGDLENSAEMVMVGYLKDDDAPVVRVDKCKDGIKGKEYPLAWNDTWCGFMGEAAEEPEYEPRYQ